MILMVVSDLNFVGLAFEPAKTKSPLVVDSDTVLSFAITAQLFQAISGCSTQIVERFGRIKHYQFTQGSALQFSRKLLDAFAAKKALGVLVSKAAYHIV